MRPALAISNGILSRGRPAAAPRNEPKASESYQPRSGESHERRRREPLEPSPSLLNRLFDRHHRAIQLELVDGFQDLAHSRTGRHA